MGAASKKEAKPDWNPDDEITVQRRVHNPAPADAEVARRRTTQMKKVDSRLLAIARGELEPDEVDPFGGLIPIYDEDPPVSEIDDDWLVLEPEPEPETGPPASDTMFMLVRPLLRLRPDEVMVLPVGDRTARFVSQIDGKRTVRELADRCGMDDLESLEICDELLRMGAIDLR